MNRLAGVDRLRGLALIVITIDHASATFNGGRFARDSAALSPPGTVLPTADFLLRWIAHPAMTAFVFLAGVSAALAAERKPHFDRYLITRGLIFIALDLGWMSLTYGPFAGRIVVGALTHIGGGLIALAALRRIPRHFLAPLAITVIALAERLHAGWIVWGCVLVLGWCLRARVSSKVAIISFMVFVVVRGANGYGNEGLPRDDGSILQWLHVSKYPPSLSFVAMNLAVVAALSALLRRPGFPAVLGRHTLSYYLVHFHLFCAWAVATGTLRAYGIPGTLTAAAVALGVVTASHQGRRWLASRH